MEGCGGDEIQLKGQDDGREGIQAVAQGFTYSSEEDQWRNGDFAIFIPSVKDEYEFPTEAKYAGKPWVAKWRGVSLIVCGSVNESIVHLEELGLIPVFEEEGIGETAPKLEPEPDVGGGDGKSDRYISMFPVTCSWCKDIRMYAGVFRLYPVIKNGGWQMQLNGKCHTCGKGKNVPIKKDFLPLIPDTIKAAALAEAGLA